MTVLAAAWGCHSAAHHSTLKHLSWLVSVLCSMLIRFLRSSWFFATPAHQEYCHFALASIGAESFRSLLGDVRKLLSLSLTFTSSHTNIRGYFWEACFKISIVLFSISKTNPQDAWRHSKENLSFLWIPQIGMLWRSHGTVCCGSDGTANLHKEQYSRTVMYSSLAGDL